MIGCSFKSRISASGKGTRILLRPWKPRRTVNTGAGCGSKMRGRSSNRGVSYQVHGERAEALGSTRREPMRMSRDPKIERYSKMQER